MKNELKEYFERLIQLYKKEFNTYPTAPYLENCDLFIKEPDNEGEAEWRPIEIEQIDLLEKDKLNEELIEFYSSYYYMYLRGEFNGIKIEFNISMYSNELINKNINTNISDGKYYFGESKCIFIGNAYKDGNDDLLVFYDIKNQSVFIYDQDKKDKLKDNYKLLDIIKNLNPII